MIVEPIRADTMSTTDTAPACAPRWLIEDLAEATAKALALAMIEHAVVGVITNDQSAPRDGRAEAA